MRRIGALAGLAPVAMVAALFLITGSTAAPVSIAAGLAGITVGAMAAGWLVGHLATGTFRADIVAVVAYALLGSLLYLVVGTVGMAWTETARRSVSDLGSFAQLIAGRLLYGLLYIPFWAGFVAPFAVGWVVAVRFFRRRAGLTPARVASSDSPGGSNPAPTIRPRRIALLAAAIILVYGLFVALLPLAIYDDLRPPWWLYRPIALFCLFAVPAVVASIAAIHGVRLLLVAAGVLCLLQAFIAFSGITIGFVVPAIVLLVVGAAESWPEDARPTRTALFAGVAVIVLTMGAWVSLLALTAPRCYFTSSAGDGTLTYTEVPATETALHGPAPIIGDGGGCGSAELTVQGMSVSAVLAIGAITLAASAASGDRTSRRT